MGVLVVAAKIDQLTAHGYPIREAVANRASEWIRSVTCVQLGIPSPVTVRDSKTTSRFTILRMVAFLTL
jgi:hypothetical protein